MTTCFQKAVEFNYSFGVLKSPILDPKYYIYQNEPHEIKNAVKLITEEYKEYELAHNNNDLIEMVDALVDLSYVVHGMSARMGINFDTVYESYLQFKMSRLGKEFKTKTSFQKTIEYNNFREKLTEKKLYDGFSLVFLMNIMKGFNEAIEKKSWDETINGLIQIEYYVNSKIGLLNISMDEAYNIVHENNMSKLCKTEEEAHKTVEKYKESYDSPKYRKTADNKHWIVYNESTAKILKSINYKPVDLSAICKK